MLEIMWIWNWLVPCLLSLSDFSHTIRSVQNSTQLSSQVSESRLYNLHPHVEYYKTNFNIIHFFLLFECGVYLGDVNSPSFLGLNNTQNKTWSPLLCDFFPSKYLSQFLVITFIFRIAINLSVLFKHQTKAVPDRTGYWQPESLTKRHHASYKIKRQLFVLAGEGCRDASPRLDGREIKINCTGTNTVVPVLRIHNLPGNTCISCRA